MNLKKGQKMTADETQKQNSHESDAPIATREHDSDEADANRVGESKQSDLGGKERPQRRRSVSVSLKGLVFGVVIAALIVSVAALGWLYIDARRQLDAQSAQSAAEARAEKIALDYAVNAATMDYKDLQAWHVKLVAGTTPELTKKLSDAGTSMEQVLVPLQWSSTAEPLVAKVRSVTDGIYVVDSFVSVQTKTIQAPDALQSTATYSTTIDSNNDWRISDVGGIGSAMEAK